MTRSTACVPGTSWLRPIPSAASDSSARPAPSTTRVSGRRVVRNVRDGVKRDGGLVTPLLATKSCGTPDVDDWITIAPPAALHHPQQNICSSSVRSAWPSAAKTGRLSWSPSQWTRTNSPVRRTATNYPRRGSQRQSRARCSRSSYRQIPRRDAAPRVPGVAPPGARLSA